MLPTKLSTEKVEDLDPSTSIGEKIRKNTYGIMRIMSSQVDETSRWLTSLWWRPGSLGLAGLWLLPLSALYRLTWWVRSALFRWGLFAIHRAPVPVVVVGNLVVGGGGKTPCTMALVKALKDLGWVPGVISRGYKGSTRTAQAVCDVNGKWPDAQSVGDEPLLLAKRLRVPLWVGARRIEAARALCAAHPEVNVLVCDDGLQHTALHRDAELIVFDDRGVGNGHVLPAGPLRQPWTATPPANSVVVYGGVRASTPWSGDLAVRRLGRIWSFSDWAAGRQDTARELSEWMEGPLAGEVHALAGIADPDQFFAMLRQAGLSLIPHPRADHVSARAFEWPEGARPIVITEKDAVKVPQSDPIIPRLWVATLDCELPPHCVSTLVERLSAARSC